MQHINHNAESRGPRRAFRDVTNSSRHANEKDKGEQPLAKKRNVPVVISKTQQKPVSDEVMLQKKVANQMSISIQEEKKTIEKHQSYQYTGPVDNIDSRDADEPLCATAYVQDMYSHFRFKEASTSVKPIYMEYQKQINERMRTILVDWLVEVHLKFKMVPETLYLTVNVIDRFLEKAQISRPKLQLLGVSALLLASKYEEIYPPSIEELIYMCDNAYTKEKIIKMEENILNHLEYKMTIPSAHAFLVRFLKAAHADRQIVQISCYILDGTLQSYSLLHYLPSQLAAAAVMIARKIVGRNPWSPTLLRYTSYCEEDIIPVAKAILAEKSSSDFSGVDRKYKSSKYGGVAKIPVRCDLF